MRSKEEELWLRGAMLPRTPVSHTGVVSPGPCECYEQPFPVLGALSSVQLRAFRGAPSAGKTRPVAALAGERELCLGVARLRCRQCRDNILSTPPPPPPLSHLN